jgi:putative oxidoreductase
MSALQRLLSNRWVVVSSQTVIGVVFLTSGLAKIADVGSFARQIHYFRMLPLPLENLTAIVLPWVELVMALAILLRIRPRAGSVVGVGLMMVFVVAVGAALARGLDIECGCFGTADATRVGAAKLLENVGLLALAAIGCRSPFSRQEERGTQRSSLTPAEAPH